MQHKCALALGLREYEVYLSRFHSREPPQCAVLFTAEQTAERMVSYALVGNQKDDRCGPDRHGISSRQHYPGKQSAASADLGCIGTEFNGCGRHIDLNGHTL